MLKRLLIGAATAVLLTLTPAAHVAPLAAAGPHPAVHQLADLARAAKQAPHQADVYRTAIATLDTRGTFGVAGSLA